MVTIAKEEKKCFSNNKIPVDSNYHWKKLSKKEERKKKVATSKNLHFEKKVPKVKKHLHLNFLTNFHKTFTYHDYNFAPKKKPVNLWFNFS